MGGRREADELADDFAGADLLEIQEGHAIDNAGVEDHADRLRAKEKSVPRGPLRSSAGGGGVLVICIPQTGGDEADAGALRLLERGGEEAEAAIDGPRGTG
ncbi:hypothetical protein J31TS4_24390 [Paenibacillus sp. J31TS4]|nr:hypothetical protein J31TS4_24390 [Paenibacillus sp. J31TS4]